MTPKQTRALAEKRIPHECRHKWQPYGPGLDICRLCETIQTKMVDLLPVPFQKDKSGQERKPKVGRATTASAAMIESLHRPTMLDQPEQLEA